MGGTEKFKGSEDLRRRNREACRRYRTKDIEAARERGRKHDAKRRLNKTLWKDKNPEKWNEYQKKWVKENREKRRKIENRYNRKNPSKVQQKNRNRYAKLKGATGNYTGEEFEKLCKEYNNCCAYCGKNEKLTVDHDIPLSRGGSNYITNIIPACRSCNCRKQALTADEFRSWLLFRA